MSETRKLLVESLVTALDAEIQSRGHGSISDVERELGMKTSWWQDRAKAQDLTVRQFSAILHYLGLDPARFMAPYLNGLELLAFDQLRGSSPPLVEMAWKRYQEKAKGPGVGAAMLADLNEKAYREPAAALKLIRPLVELADPRELTGLLEVAGVSHWALFELDLADHCFQAALEIANQLDNKRQIGNLLRRYSYVIAARGDYERALQVVRAAIPILLRENDELGLAKLCVEMGQWLWLSGQEAEAMSSFLAALRRLSESEGRYRFAAHQCLGIGYQLLGQPAEALECLHSAKHYLGSVSTRDQAKLLWLQAGIQEELGALDSATELLGNVVETFRKVHLGEAAIATCDFVRLKLLQGQGEAAYEAALTTRALVAPLADNAIISAAITELLRAERSGLTLALVVRVKRAMEAARADRKSWWSLVTSR